MSSPAHTPDHPVVLTDRTDEFFERPDDERPDDTSQSAPVFGGLLVLSFAVPAVGCAYFGIANYLGNASFSDPIVLFPLGGALVAAIAVGATTKMITWRSHTVPEDAPWTLRPAWQSPILEEDPYFRSVPPWSAAVFAVAGWGGSTIFFVQGVWLRNVEALLLLLLFPIAFTIPAVMAFRRVRHRWKYGLSTLEMNTMPGRLGQTLDACVRANVDPDPRQDDRFEVTLTCYHRSKNKNNISWRSLWEVQAHVGGHRAFSAQTAGARTETRVDEKVEIPISFDLPAEAPCSTPEKKSHRIAWILDVSAKRGGLDYQSNFEIPVFEPEEAFSDRY